LGAKKKNKYRIEDVLERLVYWTTDWMTEEPWFDSQQGHEIFLSYKASRQTLLPTQPTVEWAQGGYFPDGKAARP